MASQLDDVLFGRPQLLFQCRVRPVGGSEQDTILCSLVYFSSFERVKLTEQSATQLAGIPMYYEPGPWPDSSTHLPVMHVAFVENILCRAPLMPCYLQGNSTPTIPYSLRLQRLARFPFGRADTAQDAGNGSRLYEVNFWLWNSARGKPRHMPVAEAVAKRRASRSDAAKRGWASRKARAARSAAAQAASAGRQAP